LFRSLIKPFEVSLIRSGNNFDFLRILASSLVVIHHAAHLSGNEHALPDPIRSILGMSMGYFALLTFFVLSGFLVSHSWQKRRNTLDFIAARVLRIYPGLIVAVLFTACILGPVLSDLSWSDYFKRSLFHQYLMNLSSIWFYYYLPGVFLENPSHSVNGSLWTLSHELVCYFLLWLMGILRIIRKRVLLLIVLVGMVLLDVFFPVEIRSVVIPIVGIGFDTLYTLLLFFVSGAAFYAFKEKVPFHFPGMLAAFLLMYLMHDTSVYTYLAVLLFPYFILCIAFAKPFPLRKVSRISDLTYGIFLYAFPVQQSIIHFSNDIPLLWLIALTFTFTLPIAFLSRRLVEKPASQLRKRIHFPSFTLK
jgi:peptidoglycan/LPS O-acetylase OafA/YrhL